LRTHGPGGGVATGSVTEALLAMLLSDKITGEPVGAGAGTARSAEAEAIPQRIRDQMKD
jgi:hypothetical protein